MSGKIKRIYFSFCTSNVKNPLSKKSFLWSIALFFKEVFLFFPPARRRAAAKKMKGLSKDSSKEEEELDDMEMTDPFSDLQVSILILRLPHCG